MNENKIEIEDKIKNIIDDLQKNSKLNYSLCIIDLITQLKLLENIYKKENFKYLMRTCIILHDSLKKLNIGEINNIKIEIIKEIINKILDSKEDITREDFLRIDDLLIKNNMDWIIGWE